MSHNNVSLNVKSDWVPPFQLLFFGMASCKIQNSPQWLRTQTRIQHLDLSNAYISGEQREWFCNTSSLLSLNLSHNDITGSLPKQFGSLELEELDISKNNLSGAVPNWLSNLRQVKFIDLSSNQFSGSIPLTLENNCNILMLLLNNNKFEGIIPPSLKNCSSLEILDLSKNRLSGKIPPQIGEKLQYLIFLLLEENQLGEATAADNSHATIPQSLCNMTSLSILDLRKNQLMGKIPDCWQIFSSLEMIDLSSNKLSGVIPCSLGNISRLEYLHFNDNELHGEIPSCIRDLHRLKILDYGENELSGVLPSWLNGEMFSNLQVLRITENDFNGTIHNHLCSLLLLRVLDLSGNKFTGNIPACFGYLKGINIPPNYTTNINMGLEFSEYLEGRLTDIDRHYENSVNESIAGTEREYSSILKFLATIDLSRNNLVGPIPEELTKLSGLIALNLARNHLTGKIPEKIGDMKALKTLDLSENKLCGRIPTSLGTLNFINHLNFSNNNLSGPMPTGSQLQTLVDPLIYAGNPYLCGKPLLKECLIHHKAPEGQQNDNEKENKLENMWFYLVVMSGFATGFWIVVGTFLLKKRWGHALMFLTGSMLALPRRCRSSRNG